MIVIAVGVPALTGQNDLNDLFGTYLPEWKNVDLKEHILQKYNVEAIIVNDVELALIGERERGVGKTDEYCLHKIRRRLCGKGDCGRISSKRK